MKEILEGSLDLFDMDGRELTWNERARWGVCPICKAPAGEFCYADVGLQLGQKADGSRMRDGDGVHLVRLHGAPVRVYPVGRDR